MMTGPRKVPRETKDAAKALADWLESQNIAPLEALPVLTIVIISIIDLMGVDAEGKKEGATITARNILRKFVGAA